MPKSEDTDCHCGHFFLIDLIVLQTTSEMEFACDAILVWHIFDRNLACRKIEGQVFPFLPNVECSLHRDPLFLCEKGKATFLSSLASDPL